MVAAMWAPSATDTPVAATPPTFTVAPETKFEPMICAAVPPGARPDAGAIDETTGDPGSGVGVFVGVRVAVRVGVMLGVTVGVRVAVAVGVRVDVGVRVAVALDVSVAVRVKVGVWVGVRVRVAVRVGVAVGPGPVTLTLSMVDVFRTRLLWLVSAIPTKTLVAMLMVSEPTKVHVMPSAEL
jgi:hypothetical protein